jgi:hypothetical protein
MIQARTSRCPHCDRARAASGQVAAVPSEERAASSFEDRGPLRDMQTRATRSRIDLREPVTSGRAARGSAAGAPVR